MVFGDSDFAIDANFSAYANGDLIINAVDWAVGQENLISLTPKNQTTRMLMSPKQSNDEPDLPGDGNYSTGSGVAGRRDGLLPATAARLIEMIRKSTWIVLLIFAVLLAVVFLWQRIAGPKVERSHADCC